MLKKCHFDKRHSKFIPIKRSHAAKKTHYITPDSSVQSYIPH